jgi:hypothetical protein
MKLKDCTKDELVEVLPKIEELCGYSNLTFYILEEIKRERFSRLEQESSQNIERSKAILEKMKVIMNGYEGKQLNDIPPDVIERYTKLDDERMKEYARFIALQRKIEALYK